MTSSMVCFLPLVATLMGATLASTNENVYVTSSYGQLVTSSTIR